MILEEIKEEYVKNLLKKGKRADGRGLTDYRPITVQKGFLQNTEGSALASIGETKVLAGIKFDVMEPFRDRPDEGVMMVNSEFCILAHPGFESGPPNERAIELARVVDRGIRSAEAIDVKKFVLEEGKVLGLFIDLWVIDHSGNLIDTAALAAMGALACTKVPKYEDGAIIRTEFTGPLEVARDVVATSFEKIEGKAVVDANDEEEIASEARMTFATCGDDLVCAAQKSGRGAFTKDELLGLVDLAFEKRKELMGKIR
ncbi:MAG: exosome complex protein Rrp42 [Candidatus Micrarchaeota archaeon]|nr:exosome complex protein Rrp42 [Candidatus Micrarchaeota archaeon]